jgi:hypothetical protein
MGRPREALGVECDRRCEVGDIALLHQRDGLQGVALAALLRDALEYLIDAHGGNYEFVCRLDWLSKEVETGAGGDHGPPSQGPEPISTTRQGLEGVSRLRLANATRGPGGLPTPSLRQAHAHEEHNDGDYHGPNRVAAHHALLPAPSSRPAHELRKLRFPRRISHDRGVAVDVLVRHSLSCPSRCVECEVDALFCPPSCASAATCRRERFERETTLRAAQCLLEALVGRLCDYDPSNSSRVSQTSSAVGPERPPRPKRSVPA